MSLRFMVCRCDVDAAIAGAALPNSLRYTPPLASRTRGSRSLCRRTRAKGAPAKPGAAKRGLAVYTVAGDWPAIKQSDLTRLRKTT